MLSISPLAGVIASIIHFSLRIMDRGVISIVEFPVRIPYVWTLRFKLSFSRSPRFLAPLLAGSRGFSGIVFGCLLSEASINDLPCCLHFGCDLGFRRVPLPSCGLSFAVANGRTSFRYLTTSSLVHGPGRDSFHDPQFQN